MIGNISNINTSNKVLGAYKAQVEAPQGGGQRISKTDTAHISEEGQAFQAVLDAVYKAPDIREERVNELSSKINNGEYNISSRDIAMKMLNEGWL